MTARVGVASTQRIRLASVLCQLDAFVDTLQHYRGTKRTCDGIGMPYRIVCHEVMPLRAKRP